MSRRLLRVMLCLGSAATAAEPLQLHPENPKYFLFRGKPLVLVTATEHYGSVINRPFDFEKYLADAAAKRMTLTRTFLLFREQQSSRNPSSPCKPESPDYIAPFPRPGPGKALDGEPLYDLDRWNPEYFERLDRFLRKASDLGVVVELTLFSNSYGDGVWALNPFRARNNKQRVGNVEWPEYTSLKDRDLVTRQLAYARKIVQETSRYDNIYYEIANEPGGGVANHVSPAEVDAWQEEVARAVRDELQKAGRQILISGQEAFSYTPRHTFPQDKGLGGSLLDIVNVHPLPNTIFDGRAYDLGNFMSMELRLSEMRDFSSAVYSRRKPVVHDEDNTASMYRDPAGWTIHRKRAWTALLNGAHYDYIDFSVAVGNETGTPASNRGIRSWMQHLSEFIHSFDVIHARPMPDWISANFGSVVVSALGVEGTDYIAYIGDSREAGDPQAGAELGGEVSLALPPGRFAVTLYSPVTGLYSPAWSVDGGRKNTLQVAPFRHDVAIRAVRLH